MPRPSIKIGNAAKKSVPKGLPGATRIQEKVTPKELAEKAVQDFQEERALLDQMKVDFEEKFPDAYEFLQNIKKQEDVVNDSIASAKSLVAQVGETVGDFLCKRKFSKPRYSDEGFTKLVAELGDADTVLELAQGGHIKKIALADTATAWFASHPNAAQAYQPAWEEKQELTPAVTVPKLG